MPQDVIPLIEDWLQVCDDSHARCQLSAVATLPTRLVEIVNWEKGALRLASLFEPQAKYITLSYRWGDTASSGYITTTSNIESRLVGFNMNGLPATIRDAITLTNMLKIRYIWIDAM
jgi:hypothetical protein